MKPDHEIVIIGAGITGIGIGAQLVRNGISDFVLVDRSSNFGGTWRDNVYPGVAVDMPCVTYQYSFARNADWQRLFPVGTEVNDYHVGVARDHGLHERVLFDTDIVREEWDDAERMWRLHTADEREITARFVVSAVGAFLRPKRDAGLEGAAEFEGKFQVPAQWDHSYDVAGKRVAVIGTGASSVQITPSIAPQAAQVDVYQRTPAWCLPKRDVPTAQWFRTALKVPGFAAMLQFMVLAGTEMFFELLTIFPGRIAKPILRVVDARAIRRYRAYVAKVVHDPATAALLTPTYGPLGKRPTASNCYLQAFNRDNVALLTERIDRLTPSGIRTADGVERAYDMVVLATGYEVFSDPESYRPGTVVGRDGFDLAKFFAEEGLQAYESVAVPGLPNRWIMAGPYSWIGPAWHTIVEVAARHVVRALTIARDSGAELVEVRPEAHTRYHDGVRRRGRTIRYYFTELNRVRTYYVNSQGDTPYLRPSTVAEAWWRSRHFSISDYRIETASVVAGEKRQSVGELS